MTLGNRGIIEPALDIPDEINWGTHTLPRKFWRVEIKGRESLTGHRREKTERTRKNKSARAEANRGE